MATQEGRELDREAQAHMALAVLLRKRRSPARSEEVRRILQSELSTAEIVESIRRLDSRVEAGGAEAPPEDTESHEQPPGAPAPSGRAPNPYRLSLSKLRSILKFPRVRAPYFRYLFHEFSRMAQFGRLTHVFSPLFLLPLIRLEASIPRFFIESLIPWANELQAFLAPVLVIGWKYLSKKEYNTIVALDRLCREVASVNFRLLNPRDRNLIDKLRTLEALFLSFHYDPETAGDVVKAVDKVMTAEPELSPKADQTRQLANQILQPELTMPSLYNVLLGLNMVKYRKVLTLPELLTSDLGELFEAQSYACVPAVETEIRAMIDELKNKIVKLHWEWNRLKRLKELLNMGQSDEPRYLELARLYEYGSSTLQTRFFKEDQKNIMDFALHFFRRFEAFCYPLLGGSVRLDEDGRVEIFSIGVFQNELDRLRLTASKLERAAFGFRSFPYSRYLSIRRDGKAGISAELDVVARLDEATSALISVGRKLERILASSTRNPTSTEVSAEEQAMRPQQPVDTVPSPGSRPVLIPYRGEPIAAGSWLSGMSVSDALSAVASVCLQGAFYLYDPAFIQMIASEHTVRRQIDNHLEVVRRLADAPAYDQLVAVLLQTS